MSRNLGLALKHLLPASHTGLVLNVLTPVTDIWNLDYERGIECEGMVFKWNEMSRVFVCVYIVPIENHTLFFCHPAWDQNPFQKTLFHLYLQQQQKLKINWFNLCSLQAHPQISSTSRSKMTNEFRYFLPAEFRVSPAAPMARQQISWLLRQNEYSS